MKPLTALLILVLAQFGSASYTTLFNRFSGLLVETAAVTNELETKADMAVWVRDLNKLFGEVSSSYDPDVALLTNLRTLSKTALFYGSALAYILDYSGTVDCLTRVSDLENKWHSLYLDTQDIILSMHGDAEPETTAHPTNTARHLPPGYPRPPPTTSRFRI